MDFFRERWFLLPILSAALLILALPPINFWPLVALALAPLFYAVCINQKARTWEVVRLGALTGSFLIFSLYYLTLFQFHWLPGSEGLVMLVRAGIVPATLFGAALLGLCLYLYSHLRTPYITLNALLGGLAYLAFELVFTALFQGYYTGTLGYTLAPVPFMMSLASLGGVTFVSFIVAAFSCLVAEVATVRGSLSVHNKLGVAALLGSVMVLSLGNTLYLSQPSPLEQSVSVAIVQWGSSERMVFGEEVPATLAGHSFEQVDLVVYPLSFFDGILYEDTPPSAPFAVLPLERAGEWVAAAFPGGTTVVTWDSVVRNNTLYNTFEFWKDGSIVAEYKKQSLHFLDSTPAWLENSGVYSSPFAYEVGEEPGPTEVAGVSIGALICSELVDGDVVAAQAEGASFLLSIGSEAMFVDDTIGHYSLRAAQFRAAEYNVPVIRTSVLGPSALIDRRGRLLAYAPWGERHVLMGEVELREPRPTVYAQVGHLPLLLLGSVVLAVALYVRRRAKFLRTREQ